MLSVRQCTTRLSSTSGDRCECHAHLGGRHLGRLADRSVGCHTYSVNEGTLEGRTALVTGGGEGIGRSIAESFSANGAFVVVSGRRESSLLEVVTAIRHAGGGAEFVVSDVTDAASIERAVHAAASFRGSLDILVTAAGYSHPGPALTLSASDAARMVDVGLLGTFLSCQAAGQVMIERGYGKIITLSSTLASTVTTETAVYSSVKAAVSHLTRALAVEWAGHGVRVNSLAPTSIETPSRAAMMTDELRERLLSRIPLGRFAQPQDIAEAALFLASEASDFITGQTLFVDGGWTAKG